METNPIVQASNGTRFSLLSDRMIQRGSKNIPAFCGGYILFRTDLKKAVEEGKDYVGYDFVDYVIRFKRGPGKVALNGSIEEGDTQRGKKFFRIGCMRFVGKERIKLLKWAKA